MTDKELKRLSRVELLEMLLAQVKENEELKHELNRVQDKLKDREIRINKAGSIAEAALQLNDVFEAAQQAAAQYLENIEQLSSRQEEMCLQMEESRKSAEKLLFETKKKCIAMESEASEKCDSMVKNAELQAQKYWDEVYEKTTQLSKM